MAPCSTLRVTVAPRHANQFAAHKGAHHMTRKDFNLIAETIRLLPSFEAYQHDGNIYPTDVVNFSAVCRRFAEALRTTAPGSAPTTFINACNGKDGLDHIHDGNPKLHV